MKVINKKEARRSEIKEDNLKRNAQDRNKSCPLLSGQLFFFFFFFCFLCDDDDDDDDDDDVEVAKFLFVHGPRFRRNLPIWDKQQCTWTSNSSSTTRLPFDPFVGEGERLAEGQRSRRESASEILNADAIEIYDPYCVIVPHNRGFYDGSRVHHTLPTSQPRWLLAVDCCAQEIACGDRERDRGFFGIWRRWSSRSIS